MQLRDIIPELVFGGLVIAVAAGLAWHQWRSWQRQRDELAGDPAAALQSWRQLRRRLQVSVLLAVIGIMLPIGVWQPLFQKRLLLFLIYWLVVFLTICWVVLLALGDLLATAVHSQIAGSQLRQERRQLEEDLERYRREHDEGSASG